MNSIKHRFWKFGLDAIKDLNNDIFSFIKETKTEKFIFNAFRITILKYM